METTNGRLSLLERVEVLRSGQAGPYGHPMQIEDVSWELREEIAEALIAGAQTGRIDVGVNTYRWRVED